MANHLKFKGACQQLGLNHGLGELFNSLSQEQTLAIGQPGPDYRQINFDNQTHRPEYLPTS
jgi:hypothetical protein